VDSTTAHESAHKIKTGEGTHKKVTHSQTAHVLVAPNCRTLRVCHRPPDPASTKAAVALRVRIPTAVNSWSCRCCVSLRLCHSVNSLTPMK
jgi:hypothetical protein